MAELGSHQIDVTNWFTGHHPLAVVGIGGLDSYKDAATSTTTSSASSSTRTA